MATKRLVSQVLNRNPQGIRLRGRPKRDGGTVYEQTLTNAKLKTGKRGKKIELTGRRPLRGRRFALDCSAVSEEAVVVVVVVTFLEPVSECSDVGLQLFRCIVITAEMYEINTV